MRAAFMMAVIAFPALMNFCAAVVVADDDGAERPKIPWTVEDLVMQERATGWELSDDGSLAIWLKRVPDKKKDRAFNTLMITEIGSGTSRPLTVGAFSVAAPSFVPDCHSVTYLSTRPPPEGEEPLPEKQRGPQIWRLDLRGGEARRLTQIPFGVGAYQWVDAKTIVLSTREKLSHVELVDRKHKDDTRVVEDPKLYEDRGRQLFRFSVDDKKLDRISDEEGPAEQFAASRDGRYVVAMHGQSASFEAEGKSPPKCLIHDLENGTATELFAERKSKPRRFVWRFDSQGFYVLYPYSTVDGEDSGAITVVKEVSVPSLEVRDVSLDWERGVGSGGGIVPSRNGFVALLADGTRYQAARYRREVAGYRKEALRGEHAERIFAVATARDSDAILYVTGSASDPDHVMSARLDGPEIENAKEIYRPNGGFSERPIARSEVIQYRGALDQEVEALVYYPDGYEEGKRYPLVLITHGGPHAATIDRFRESWASSPNAYAQRGAFVLMVNYHGSSNYGLAFGESIKGKYYELEIKDMFAGIQKLVDEGLVDRRKMGLVGWSNGAILSTGALTLAHLYAPGYDFTFKACAPGAGDVNWTSDYGNCQFGPVFDDYYLGGSPWKLPEVYLEKSPLFHVERVTTPTIIFFGTEDTNVPTEQGWEWFRAMHLVEKAPVRFLLFPGEPHGLLKLSHQRRKLDEEFKWLEKYLFETEQPPETAVQDNSPLDVAQKRSGWPQQDGAYGVSAGRNLVPECVPFGDIEVGRFEVTRAQWQSFRRDTDVPAEKRNFPVVGIGSDDAQAYVEWLRETSGDAWRLLTAKEFAKLEAAATGSQENTLDWWAGYDPPPADAQVLAADLMKLPHDEVLFPVGSRPPGIYRRGPETILYFDVGGNAAEWVTDAKGAGKVAGGCAVSATGRRSDTYDPPPEFIGLRVAKGDSPSQRPE